jgi:hypothetical protein
MIPLTATFRPLQNGKCRLPRHAAKEEDAVRTLIASADDDPVRPDAKLGASLKMVATGRRTCDRPLISAER